jgi:hypothetical protein
VESSLRGVAQPVAKKIRLPGFMVASARSALTNFELTLVISIGEFCCAQGTARQPLWTLQRQCILSVHFQRAQTFTPAYITDADAP